MFVKILVQYGLAAIAVLLCSGCVGIAHVRVYVPEMAVVLRGTEAKTTVDLLCPEFYSEPEAFSALVSSRLSRDDRRHEWKRVEVGSAPVREVCRGEDRTIGFPMIVFVPTSPSDESARSRALLLQIAGDPNLYRVRLHGTSSRVEAIPLAEAQRAYPRQLDEPEPQPFDPKWAQRIQLRLDYYRSMTGQPSSRIVVKNVETSGEAAIDSVALEIGRAR